MPGCLNDLRRPVSILDSVQIFALLTQMPGQNLASIRDSIVSAAQAFGKQVDDQTILLIRRAEQIRGTPSDNSLGPITPAA